MIVDLKPRRIKNSYARSRYRVSVASPPRGAEAARVGTRVGRFVNAMMTAPSRQTAPAMMKGVIQTDG